MDKLEKALAKARAAEAAQAAPLVAKMPPPEPAAAPAAAVPPVAEAPRQTAARSQLFKVRPRHLAKMRIVAADDHAPEADIYRLLRTQVMQRMRSKGARSLAICSPNRGDGKTLTAVNLAVSMCREIAQTVILVDADLRRPAVHRCFGVKPEKGLADYLLSGEDLSSYLIIPEIERLVLLPGRSSVGSSSELLKSERMSMLASEIRNRYPDRIVVYDLPPMMASDDAIGFLPQVDSILMVVREGETPKEGINRSLDLIERDKLLGVVLNGASIQSDTYYGY